MFVSLVAGLGNPGSCYTQTRHNIGFLVVDELARSLGVQWVEDVKLKVHYAKASVEKEDLFLVKPQAFMNLSGQVLKDVCQCYALCADQLLVVYDDINIDLGAIKVAIGGSAGGHKGVNDIIVHCGNNFIRFRVGIGYKKDPAFDLKDYVLGKFTKNEKSVLTFQFPEYINCLKYLISNGPLEAMQWMNQKKRNSMSMIKTLRSYKATFLLDLRNYENPVETLIERLTNVIEAIGGVVEKVQNLGQKDFVRVTNKKFPSGMYVEIAFSGPSNAPATLKDKLKLDKAINRILVIAL